MSWNKYEDRRKGWSGYEDRRRAWNNEPKRRGPHDRDPKDRGNLPERLEPLSRRLAMLLRHDGPYEGLEFDDDGWCKVQDVLAHPEFVAKEATLEDVFLIVRESFSKDRPRFEVLEKETEPGEQPVLLVKATGKHTNVNTDQGGDLDAFGKGKSGGYKGGKGGYAPRARPPSTWQPPLPLGPPPNETESQCLTPPPLPTESFPSQCLTPRKTNDSSVHELTPEKVSLRTDEKLTECVDGKMCDEVAAEQQNEPLRTDEELTECVDGKMCDEVAAEQHAAEILGKWEKFCSPEGHEWWWNEAAQELTFFESEPNGWQRFEEPTTKRIFWFCDEKHWFYTDSGRKE